ncbi:NACHT domain-containing protein [Colletotrichum higginsianum IMI 349063]|uniref:NACHT domain-containing protein n=1 Tax=Colletotrichum higginsianum (strain IMI 349063) TaxID=759273 RepID=A0A1B7Y4W9_COLHI|nr:NACHT domain-containing protein [Colletotrichum higginsianum IMI 349063]OBR07060.1 NACHT domain-containing protein [Colletotrichum higginsianum IMI 349063]
MRRLTPLLNGIEHYSKVMEILCNGTPFLSWVWAPVTLILRIACEYVEAFEHIMKGYSRIASFMTRFELLSKAYASDHGFQQSLAAFYDDILQFHTHAYKFVRRNGWKLLFVTSWGRLQRRFDNILGDMEKHGDLIDKDTNALNIVESRQMRQDIRQWREESLENLSNQEAEQSAKQYQSITSWLKYDESDQLAIFDSISAEARKYPGTCSWFIQSSRVRAWLQRKADTPSLWLQGIPGSGKSFICAELINFMKADKRFVLYHFCSDSYASSTMYEQILRSLLLQLVQKNSDSVAHVYDKYILGKRAPTVPALEHLLQDLIKVNCGEPGQTEYIWVVLDGLGECQPGKQARVATLMKSITSSSSSSASGGTICKALISCQASIAISTHLRNDQKLSLTNEKVNMEKAIRKYASHRLQSLCRRFTQLGLTRDEIEDIECSIAKKADALFAKSDYS